MGEPMMQVSQQKPHVLVINVFFAPYSYGGATVVAEQVAQELRRSHGFRVSAVSAISRFDMPPYTVIKSEYDGIPNYLINLPQGRSYAETYDNPQVTEVIDGLIRSLSPDVIHMHCLQDIGVGVFSAAQHHSVPVVLSTHDFWWLCERQFMIRIDGRYCGQNPVRIEDCRGCAENMGRARNRASQLQAAAGKADLITYPSHFAQQLNEASGIRGKGDSMVWPNGAQLPSQGFFKAQAARRSACGRLSFGFVGGPSQIKGWPLIRQAFEALPHDNFDVHLVEGSLDGSWWKDVDFSDLKGNWQVHPRFSQAEMDGFYEHVDVLLFLSQWKETFGLTIREALARGIQVIQTDSGGTTEHAAADPARMLAIGEGPDRLIAELERVLSPAQAHPAPVPVTSFADQATEMAAQMRGLIAKPTQIGLTG